ncbi:MAG TPA: 23S rRNA pseudouridine(1911/1915/1917) synthase RluD [Steroidobacteraceae bacterium]|nr:23S rRNA pseudouridine(1911/1915/1917) synthase RluD [Steroidobacteraceae bacterium]
MDQALAHLLPDFSRTRIKEWIETGQVKVDGQFVKPKDKLIGGERVVVQAQPEAEVPLKPERIKLDIVHRDKHTFVVNKPAGLVVHPGAGNAQGTMQNALLHLDAKLAELPRAGIVHRLDKETSGLMIVARTLASHTALTRMIEAREVDRHYEAICAGVMTAGGTINAPIDRHPTDRVRMAVRSSGRDAVTHYRVIHRYRAHTHVRVKLETGRTHQIRVHMAHIKYPIVGDRVYGGRLLLPKGASAKLIEALRTFPRQALHAAQLEFDHPITGKHMSFSAPLPKDMRKLLKILADDSKRQ